MGHRLACLAAIAALVVTACAGAASPTPSGSAAPGGGPPRWGRPPPWGPAESPAAGGDSILRVARLADHYNFWHPVQFQTGNQFQWWSCVFNTLVEAEVDSKTVIGDLASNF